MGVGNRFATKSCHRRQWPKCFTIDGANSLPCVVGVGQPCLTIASKVLYLPVALHFPPLLWSLALGVGKDPHSVAAVRRTDVASSQHAPACVIPQARKSFDDGAEAKGTQARTVFRENKARSHLANDSQHIKPKSRTLSGKSFAATCRTDVLAGEPA